MALRINTNIASLQAQNSVERAGQQVQESLTKLSSGSRINKASDDSAGLAISEKLKTEVRSAGQAIRNTNDGISMVQVAEGALNESSSILTRMRELAIQSSSDTIGDDERGLANLEYQQLNSEIDRISQVTRFNGRNLLDGSEKELSVHVGTGSNLETDSIVIDLKNLDSGSSSLGLKGVSVETKDEARKGIESLDEASMKILGQRSIMGAVQNRLNSTANNLSVYSENLSAANSRIRDTDYAQEASNLAKNTILTSASTTLLAQANSLGQNALKLIS